MYRRETLDIMEMFPIFLGVLVGIAVVVFVILYVLKNKDNGKELVERKVKVLEKPMQQGNIAWYVMECQNGERIRLRSFQANGLIIAVGDVGIVRFKGITIQSFQRL